MFQFKFISFIRYIKDNYFVLFGKIFTPNFCKNFGMFSRLMFRQTYTAFATLAGFRQEAQMVHPAGTQ